MIAAVDRTPLVTSNAPSQLNDADSVKALLAQLNHAFAEREEGHKVTLSEAQLTSLVGMLQRAVPNVKGDINVTPMGGSVAVTFSPKNVDLYVNISTLILPDESLYVDHVSVGDVTLPGGVVIYVLEKLVNHLTSSNVASVAISRIERINMTDNNVHVDVAPLGDLFAELNQVSSPFDDGDTQLEELTAYYLRYISGREIALSPTPVPLIEYLREGMARAREQSSTPEEAVLHNKAVILALGVFVGHHRLGAFIGDVQPNSDKALKARSEVTVHNRADLARHFILSAAIQLLSVDDVSWAIGEFKELVDRGEGGSGYSFVDLAADMSGNEFALVATDPNKAQEVQNTIARVRTDSDIVPSIAGLPEGLGKAEFEQRYGEVDSPRYRDEVQRIQRRIDTLSLYQKAYQTGE